MPSPFQAPATMEEAERRLEELSARIARIQSQLTDSARLEALPLQEYAAWRARALTALRMLGCQQRWLRKWHNEAARHAAQERKQQRLAAERARRQAAQIARLAELRQQFQSAGLDIGDPAVLLRCLYHQIKQLHSAYAIPYGDPQEQALLDLVSLMLPENIVGPAA